MTIKSTEYLKLPLPAGTPRAAGVHVSDIIRRIGVSSGKPWSTPFEDIPNNIPICMGLAWEDWYLRTQCPGTDPHPGEIELDGIHGNPDGVTGLPNGLGFCIDECKLTWKSSRHNPESYWDYILQIKAYCHMLGTNYARLHIGHVHGDYSRVEDAPLALVMVHEFTFTSQELSECWKTFQTIKATIITEGGNKTTNHAT